MHIFVFSSANFSFTVVFPLSPYPRTLARTRARSLHARTQPALQPVHPYLHPASPHAQPVSPTCTHAPPTPPTHANSFALSCLGHAKALRWNVKVRVKCICAPMPNTRTQPARILPAPTHTPSPSRAPIQHPLRSLYARVRTPCPRPCTPSRPTLALQAGPRTPCHFQTRTYT